MPRKSKSTDNTTQTTSKKCKFDTHLADHKPSSMKNPCTYRGNHREQTKVFYPSMQLFKEFGRTIHWVEQSKAHLVSGVAKIIPPLEWNPRPIRKKDYSFHDLDKLRSKTEETATTFDRIVFDKGNATIDALERDEDPNPKSLTLGKSKSISTVKSFREVALSEPYKNPLPNGSVEEVVKKYWETLGIGPKPIYASDNEGSIYDEGVGEFNMNNLKTILDLLKQEENTLLAGVNTCYLYYGMWKTSFAWHSEDVDLYSINYLHYGAPKFWYSISSEYAERFERLASQLQPDYSSRCRNFLRHKTFIVHPSLLDKYSIPYTTMVQYPGEFMITFPKGYHMGFNMGFNCAESTNFAMDRWIDYGKNASLCTCANKRGHVKINMIPFMQKYRAKEFELWKRYWYDNEFSNIAEAIQLVQSNDDEKPKEVVKPKKRTQGSREHAEKLFVYGDATPLWSDLCVDFEGERRFNLKRSFAFPFCAVCQYFYPEPLAHHVEKVPYWSPRHVSDLMFSKNPNDPNLNKRRNNVRKNLDRMMYECADCGIMVHCGCYPVGVDIDQARMAAAQNDLQVSGNRDLAPMKFRCLRCREAKEIIKLSASCHLCSMRGGALIPAHKGRDKNRFVHIVCALMNRKTWFANTDTRVLAITETPRKQGSDAIESPLLTKYKNAVTEDYDQALFECEVCHGQSEGLISCLRCDETRPFLYHATCARALGLVMQRRDWPITTAMMCQNDANTFKDPTEPTFRRLHVAENVICWLNEGAQVETGTVTQINEVECCAVIFMDGSISTEVAPMDIITCACMKLAAGKENSVADDPDADEYEGPIFHADHKHVIGARCFVPWNDGRNYAAFFQGQGKVDRYVIQPDSGEEPLILTRGDLYGEDDYIPDIVLSKLPASKRGRVRKNSDRGGKNTKRRRNDAA